MRQHFDDFSKFFDIKIRKIVARPIKVQVSFTPELLQRLLQEQSAFTREIAFIGRATKQDGIWVVQYDYLPKQERFPYLVRVLEFKPGYNAVFHLHPPGVQQFSSIDYEYLNQNFELSVVVDTSNIGMVCYKNEAEEQFEVDKFILVL